MADFPLAVNVQGDYGYKVIVVDDDDTIEQVIKTATDQIVGVLVPGFPAGTVFRVRQHGTDQPLDNNLIIKDAKLMQMEALQVFVE